MKPFGEISIGTFAALQAIATCAKARIVVQNFIFNAEI
jgi:hypothetical protein